jgi:coniferyl-aldehyde dehydrogenase
MNDYLAPQAQDATALNERLAQMRAAFLRDMPVTYEIRRDRIRRAIAMTLRHADAFVAASREDFPSRRAELARLTEVFMPLDAMRHAERKLASWMKPHKRSAPQPFALFGARAQVQYQPLGVVGVIAPWNAPLTLLLLPLATILAAGNRAFLRPSDQTPACAVAIDAAVREYFDPDEVSVALGGLQTSQAFSALPLDHLLFTGSTGVGRAVAASAADNLTPLTLELGGKCPVFVLADADVAEAGRRLALGKLMNGGQGCLCPDTAFVPATLQQPLLRAMDAEVRRQAMGEDLCGLFSARHYERLQAIVDEARHAGARVITLGAEASDPTRLRMAPTVIVDPAPDLRASREELFGPVLVLRSCDEPQVTLAELRQGDKPLGLYVFARDAGAAQRVLDASFSGGATVNDTLMHLSVKDLPFGGVGHSGMGAYGFGVEGFRRFSHARAVYWQSGPFSLLRAMHPPYGKLYQLAVEGTLRRLARRYADVPPRMSRHDTDSGIPTTKPMQE